MVSVADVRTRRYGTQLSAGRKVEGILLEAVRPDGGIARFFSSDCGRSAFLEAGSPLPNGLAEALSFALARPAFGPGDAVLSETDLSRTLAGGPTEDAALLDAVVRLLEERYDPAIVFLPGRPATCSEYAFVAERPTRAGPISEHPWILPYLAAMRGTHAADRIAAGLGDGLRGTVRRAAQEFDVPEEAVRAMAGMPAWRYARPMAPAFSAANDPAAFAAALGRLPRDLRPGPLGWESFRDLMAWCERLIGGFLGKPDRSAVPLAAAAIWETGWDGSRPLPDPEPAVWAARLYGAAQSIRGNVPLAGTVLGKRKTLPAGSWAVLAAALRAGGPESLCGERPELESAATAAECLAYAEGRFGAARID